MTIGERATLRAYQYCSNDRDMSHLSFHSGYLVAAIEQQKIDIRRAVEWLKDMCFDDSLYSFDMDELIQAMKGE